MNYAEEENIHGLFLTVDFEKAFDSISWDFINEVFCFFFNFGKSIKNGFHFFFFFFLFIYFFVFIMT